MKSIKTRPDLIEKFEIDIREQNISKVIKYDQKSQYKLTF